MLLPPASCPLPPAIYSRCSVQLGISSLIRGISFKRLVIFLANLGYSSMSDAIFLKGRFQRIFLLNLLEN